MEQQPQKRIENISMGLTQDKAAWVFHYQGGAQESFALSLPVARQFMQGLQEMVLLLEHQAQQAQHRSSAYIEDMGVGEQVTLRLTDPHSQKD
jgi:hypothetical protein